MNRNKDGNVKSKESVASGSRVAPSRDVPIEPMRPEEELAELLPKDEPEEFALIREAFESFHEYILASKNKRDAWEIARLFSHRGQLVLRPARFASILDQYQDIDDRKEFSAGDLDRYDIRPRLKLFCICHEWEQIDRQDEGQLIALVDHVIGVFEELLAGGYIEYYETHNAEEQTRSRAEAHEVLKEVARRLRETTSIKEFTDEVSNRRYAMKVLLLSRLRLDATVTNPQAITLDLETEIHPGNERCTVLQFKVSEADVLELDQAMDDVEESLTELARRFALTVQTKESVEHDNEMLGLDDEGQLTVDETAGELSFEYSSPQFKVVS